MKKIILFFVIFIVLVNNASAYTFTNIGRDFKIEYPAGWTYTEEPDGSDQTFTSQTGRAWVRIAVVSSDGMTLDGIVGERIRYLNGLGIYPYSEKYVTINGVADKVKELMFYEDYQQKKYKERQILILSGNNYYIITAGTVTSDYPFYSEDFDQIINSFKIIQPSLSPTTTAVISKPTPSTATPTPEETDEILSSDVASIALHREKTRVDVGEEVLLKLSIVNYISNREPMEVQLIIAPPSGMSVTSTEFTQSTTGQSTSSYTLKPGQNRDIEIKLKANEIGNFNVEGKVVYYFGENKTSAVVKNFKKPITVKSAGVIPVGTTTPSEPTGDGSVVVGIIAIIAIIFTVYVIFNKVAKTIKNKFTKDRAPAEVEVHEHETEISHPSVTEEEPTRIEPEIKKESAFEAEKRKQHSALPPDGLDIETRNYLSSGVNTAISTLDAEIENAENDALRLQGAIKKNEDVLGKLGTRLVNNEISDQTYNDLKNKYMRKISELKSKLAALESDAVRLKKIRSFIHEKGKYYT